MTAEVLSFEGVQRPAVRRPVELAGEPPFRLGRLRITPGLRQVADEDGPPEILEPRVMQVLVALARAGGAIVSRDELIRTCWNGTIVSDDAINRPIALLRRLAQGLGGGAFRIETIPRVGYRLIAEPDSAPAAAPPVAPVPWFSGKPLWAAAALLLAAAGALLAWPAAPQGPSYSISLQPFRTPVAAAGFNDQLANALTSLDVPTVGGRSALTLAGSVEPDGTVNARLVMPGSHATLWSGAIGRPGAGDLADAAGLVGAIAQCALAGANDAGVIAPEQLSLYLRTCELGARGQNALGLRVSRELTRQAPGFAAGWFALSHHARMLYLSQPQADPPLRAEALAAAERLIALRPEAQDGYVGAALALDPRQRVERERLLRRAAGLEPLYVDRAQAALSDFLLEVGRPEEAFRIDRVIARQNPEQAGAQARLLLSAAATGRWPFADQVLKRMKALGGGSAAEALWRNAVWRGDWTEAERSLPRRDPAVDRAAIATYRAAAAGDVRPIEAAARQVMQLPDGCCALPQAELLTQLGRRGEAIALLEQLAAAGAPGTAPGLAAFLADPAMRSLWYDPAAEPFFRSAGLIDYWRASHTRPDVCRSPKAPAFCVELANPPR